MEEKLFQNLWLDGFDVKTDDRLNANNLFCSKFITKNLNNRFNHVTSIYIDCKNWSMGYKWFLKTKVSESKIAIIFS